MTERTIRHLAKEIAGWWYEEKRSGRFRGGNEMVRAKQVVMQDGIEIERDVIVPFKVAYPNANAFVAGWWPQFVPFAKRRMAAMLGETKVSDNIKEGIYIALQEEGEREAQGQARRLRATNFDPTAAPIEGPSIARRLQEAARRSA